MTYSDCWIDTLDDADFKALRELFASQWTTETKLSDNLCLLPPTPSPGNYWISILWVWAKKHALTVERVDELKIRVAVSRAQLLQFLDEVFWREEEAQDRSDREIIKHLRSVERVERLRAHARQCLRDDKTYFIVADEF